MGDLETYIHIVLYITAINTTGFQYLDQLDLQLATRTISSC